MIRKRQIGSLALIIATSACAAEFQQHELESQVPQAEIDAYLADKPITLHDAYASTLRQGQRNLVLNNARVGLAAMEIGETKLAGEALDIALDSIEAIYADNDTAKQARGSFFKENLKDFKGEPYERAMAFYYRGLLYLMEGDYENARASFRGGLLQDTLAAEEEYAQDFASLAFLDGWASQCNGNVSLANEGYREAQSHIAELKAPGSEDNVLLIAETGIGPLKIAGGDQKELLLFERAKGFSDQHATFFVNGEHLPTQQAEDLFWQATTRGGRAIDGVLADQAKFKEGTDSAGDALLAGGLATAALGANSRNSDVAAAGAVIALVGLFAKTISDATRPDADIRYWDNLPAKIHLATTRLDPGQTAVEATFFNDSGQLVSVKDVALRGMAGKCAIGWVRAHEASNIPAAAPNSIAVR